MRILGRFFVVLAAALGGLVGAQLPEFSQQYRQRLGGALEELRQIVADFEADARRNRLTREAALETYDRSNEGFLRDQGTTIRGTISHFERLAEQRERIEAAPPLMRPVVIMNNPDERIVRGAWADYEPSVPVTPAGFVWAVIGFFVFGGLVSLIRQVVGAARRHWRRRLQAQQGT